jgi:hypothetical protein
MPTWILIDCQLKFCGRVVPEAVNQFSNMASVDLSHLTKGLLTCRVVNGDVHEVNVLRSLNVFTNIEVILRINHDC